MSAPRTGSLALQTLAETSLCGCHHCRSINGFVACGDQQRTRESCNTAYWETQAAVLEHSNSCAFSNLDHMILIKIFGLESYSTLNCRSQMLVDDKSTFLAQRQSSSKKLYLSSKKKELLTCPEIFLACKLNEIVLNVKSPLQSLEMLVEQEAFTDWGNSSILRGGFCQFKHASLEYWSFF